MNKRIKRKHELLEAIQEVRKGQAMLSESICNVLTCVEHDKNIVNLQQEVIEDYGNQLAEVKRELADLRAVVESNAEETNLVVDDLVMELSKVRTELEAVKAKKSWFGLK